MANTETTDISTESISKPREGPSECGICYRPAHGYHYGVASCKGCKTFFRRMCVLASEPECKLNNDCFDLTKRKQLQLRCQSCRYKKCIEVGMNPYALELKEGEDDTPNYRKITKREKDVKNYEADKIVISSLRSQEELSSSTIEMLTYLDLKLNQFRMSAFNPSFMDYQQSTEQLVLCGSKLRYGDDLGPMKGWPFDNADDLPKISRMRDVRDRNSNNRFPSVFAPNNKKMWMFFNMLTTIEYAKTFMFFHKLELTDQVVLIKHVTLICMNLHNSYFAVSQKLQKCMQPDGTEQPQSDEFHHRTVSMSLAPLIRCNIQPVEYLLLKAICLCNSSVQGLSQRAQEIIDNERKKYAGILLDYCLRRGKDGPTRFAEILGIISILVHQQRLLKDIHIYHIFPIISKFPCCIQFLDDIMYA